ncbi:MAG TPA: NADH-quinone oxidoreductase subunit L, partial [Pyrodictium sp.]|nr:NADH-quinone oxidoreductase subunit L [Pyrodictium sp.]
MTGPTPVSALIHAATMVKAGVYLVLRFTPILVAAAAAGALATSQVYTIFEVLAWLGVITALSLSLMAIVSDELKLILAYSTGSQLGYMMLAAAAGGMAALAAGEALLAGEGVAAGLAHLVSHALFKASLFLAAGWLIHALHTRFIDGMGGLAKFMKLTAAAFWLAGLSLAGVPPLSGFFTKEPIIHLASVAYTGLGLLAGFTAVLTAIYTSRLVIRVFHARPYEEIKGHPHEAPPIMLAPYLILSLATLLLGIYFTGLYGYLARAMEITLGIAHAADIKLAVGASTLAVVGSAVLAIAVTAYIYLIAKIDFRKIIGENMTIATIHSFLYNRFYINPLIYIVIVGGSSYLATVAVLIDSAIDALYHVGLPAAGILGATILRRLHRCRDGGASGS